MRKITDINELHKYLFEMAKVIDKVLSEHDIPFIIAYGSLLGAVRHGGFIPWDDDMDFYVPYSKYEETWDVLKTELSDPYEVVSFKTNKECESMFYKVHNRRTLLNDKMSHGYDGKKLGINIDLFPLVENIKGTDSTVSVYKRYYKMYRMIYGKDPKNRPVNMLIKGVLQSICPISKEKMMTHLVDFAVKFKNGNDSFSYLANMDENEIIPMRYFGNLGKIKFLDYEFTCPEDVDGYLKFYFGDYMKLPPKEKQKWHNEGVFEL